jgi:hypothetical protein
MAWISSKSGIADIDGVVTVPDKISPLASADAGE